MENENQRYTRAAPDRDGRDTQEIGSFASAVLNALPASRITLH
jgi:hypothetical protein